MASPKRNKLKLEISTARSRALSRHHCTPNFRTERSLAAEMELLCSHIFPLYPQPSGPPHPDFPKTLMHWLLLTEDQLDSIAHYYSQVTRDQFTNDYPAPMGWDAEFLAHSGNDTPQLSPWNPAWLAQFGWLPREISSMSSPASWTSTTDTYVDDSPTVDSTPASMQGCSCAEPHDSGYRGHMLSSVSPEARQDAPQTPPPLSTAERIQIKRRKLGKFMGLRGCETPGPEMERRVLFYEARLQRGLREGRDDTGAMGESWRGSRGPRVGKDLL